MSVYLPAELRRTILLAAQGRCAYCQSPERLMGVLFEVDHIIPVAAGGATALENLCLACPTCNRYKAKRLTGPDPVSGIDIPLFHPRQQRWLEHFAWDESGARLLGITPIGRATLEALHMNRPLLVELRGYWIVLGLHPPARATAIDG